MPVSFTNDGYVHDFRAAYLFGTPEGTYRSVSADQWDNASSASTSYDPIPSEYRPRLPRTPSTGRSEEDYRPDLVSDPGSLAEQVPVYHSCTAADSAVIWAQFHHRFGHGNEQVARPHHPNQDRRFRNRSERSENSLHSFPFGIINTNPPIGTGRPIPAHSSQDGGGAGDTESSDSSSLSSWNDSSTDHHSDTAGLPHNNTPTGSEDQDYNSSYFGNGDPYPAMESHVSVTARPSAPGRWAGDIFPSYRAPLVQNAPLTVNSIFREPRQEWQDILDDTPRTVAPRLSPLRLPPLDLTFGSDLFQEVLDLVLNGNTLSTNLGFVSDLGRDASSLEPSQDLPNSIQQTPPELYHRVEHIEEAFISGANLNLAGTTRVQRTGYGIPYSVSPERIFDVGAFLVRMERVPVSSSYGSSSFYTASSSF